LLVVKFSCGHRPIVRFIGLLSKSEMNILLGVVSTNKFDKKQNVLQQIWLFSGFTSKGRSFFGVLWQILPKQICMFTSLLLLIRQVFMLHTWLLINKMHKRLYCTLVILFSKYKYVRLEEPGNTFSNLTSGAFGSLHFRGIGIHLIK
jgi:hypothetical protein